MSLPTPDEQVTFLVKVQRLLAEGGFVASYKFALLLALADLSVELGDDSGNALLIEVDALAEKFIGYYWRQAVPYPRLASSAPTDGSSAAPPPPALLVQNTAKQAAIIRRVAEVHQRFQGSLPKARSDAQAWRELVRFVAKTIVKMPLWRLHFVGDEFLYAHKLVGGGIELKPGVAFCFRKFYELVDDMVRGGWVRYIRRVKANQRLLGQAKDLDEFLFGSERGGLAPFRPILAQVQGADCFYCERKLLGPGEVDHFIPWARYPVDLGHNRDLAALFDNAGLVHDLEVSKRVNRWAYEQAEAMARQVWVEKKVLVNLDPRWRGLPGMAA